MCIFRLCVFSDYVYFMSSAVVLFGLLVFLRGCFSKSVLSERAAMMFFADALQIAFLLGVSIISVFVLLVWHRKQRAVTVS